MPRGFPLENLRRTERSIPTERLSQLVWPKSCDGLEVIRVKGIEADPARARWSPATQAGSRFSGTPNMRGRRPQFDWLLTDTALTFGHAIYPRSRIGFVSQYSKVVVQIKEHLRLSKTDAHLGEPDLSLMEACKCSPHFPLTGDPQSWDMMYFKQFLLEHIGALRRFFDVITTACSTGPTFGVCVFLTCKASGFLYDSRFCARHILAHQGLGPFEPPRTSLWRRARRLLSNGCMWSSLQHGHSSLRVFGEHQFQGVFKSIRLQAAQIVGRVETGMWRLP